MKYSPLIAILRGVTPDKVLDIAEILIDNGINIIEVPLNSPSPLKSIELLVEKFSDKALLGAGTVLKASEVYDLFNIGAQLIVSPNTNHEVIQETKRLKMISIPGCFTSSEALEGLANGADALKLFPASSLGPNTFNAINQILPKKTKCFAVGGINHDNIKQWIDVKITGFGIGSNIYNPKMTILEIKNKVKKLNNFVGNQLNQVSF